MSATTSSGRRRGPSKGDAREAGILRTFEHLIASKPLSAIGIDELAVGAGISRSAFYFYFSSKDAVLTALLAGLEEGLIEEHADWYRGTGVLEAEAALRRNMGYVADVWSVRGPLLRLIHLADDVPEPVLAFRKRSLDRQHRLTVERIERERAAGLAPAGPPSAAALATGLIQLRTALLCNAFAPENDGLPAGDRDLVVEDLVSSQLRLFYGEVPAQHQVDPDPDPAVEAERPRHLVPEITRSVGTTL